MAEETQDAGDRALEMCKIKKLISSLTKARGNGTSMISLILPPKSQIAQVNKMLTDEYSTASNIKSRVNRLSVLSAITSAQQRLKLYSRCPPNGLVLFVGQILTDEGKERKVNIDFEPFKPINTSLYLCDNKFHTEALGELLADDETFGFVVMDGHGSLYGTLCGNTRTVLHKFSVDLPKKHGRGGQSALRFARLRLEKRQNYVRKVAETATQLFISADKPTVKGIVLAGSADFKSELQKSDIFDPRLASIVVKVVDVSYGFEPGFNQAIDLSAEALASVKFIQEVNLIKKYFEQIALDSGKYCFGVKDTMMALEMSAVETLIVWEDLDLVRYELKNPSTGDVKLEYLKPDADKDTKLFSDPDTGVELDLVSETPLVEWFAENYKSFGATLEFITDRSQEGSQFCKGFGGVGALLRWQVNFTEMAELDAVDDFDDFI
jgi:peptide chain release factor subunit 1